MILKPFYQAATFTFQNGEIVEDIALREFTPPPNTVGLIHKPLSIVKPIDEISAQLFAAMQNGQRLRTVVITIDRLQYTLIGVFVREILSRPDRVEEVRMECELFKHQHLIGVPTRFN